MRADPFSGAPTLDELYRYRIMARASEGGRWLELTRAVTAFSAGQAAKNARASGAWSEVEIRDEPGPAKAKS